MGTTQDKLSYLGVTKDLIHEAIIEKGGTLAENATFRQYVDGIKSIPTSEGGGDVKLFKTEAEMQADPNPKENDLAIVYRKQIQNATADSTLQIIRFNRTVVLPSAFTGNNYCSFRNNDTWADASIDLSQTNFRFSFYSDSSNFEITYTSTDGITYTRTDTNPETVDTGIPLTCDEYSKRRWNDAMGYFLQVENYTFNGLYQYGLYTDKNRTLFPLTSNTLSNLENGENLEFSSRVIAYSDIMKAAEILRTQRNVETMNYTGMLDVDNNFYLLIDDDNPSNNVELGVINKSTTDLTARNALYSYSKDSKHIAVYKVSESFDTVTYIETATSAMLFETWPYWHSIEFTTNFNTVATFNGVARNENSGESACPNNSNRNFAQISYEADKGDLTYLPTIDEGYYPAKFFYEYMTYYIAPNQFNAKVSDLLKNKTVYSNTGVITGDGSISDSLIDLVRDNLNFNETFYLYELGSTSGISISSPISFKVCNESDANSYTKFDKEVSMGTTSPDVICEDGVERRYYWDGQHYHFISHTTYDINEWVFDEGFNLISSSTISLGYMPFKEFAVLEKELYMISYSHGDTNYGVEIYKLDFTNRTATKKSSANYVLYNSSVSDAFIQRQSMAYGNRICISLFQYFKRSGYSKYSHNVTVACYETSTGTLRTLLNNKQTGYEHSPDSGADYDMAMNGTYFTAYYYYTRDSSNGVKGYRFVYNFNTSQVVQSGTYTRTSENSQILFETPMYVGNEYAYVATYGYLMKLKFSDASKVVIADSQFGTSNYPMKDRTQVWMSSSKYFKFTGDNYEVKNFMRDMSTSDFFVDYYENAKGAKGISNGYIKVSLYHKYTKDPQNLNDGEMYGKINYGTVKPIAPYTTSALMKSYIDNFNK